MALLYHAEGRNQEAEEELSRTVIDPDASPEELGYAGAVYALWGIIICGVVIQPAICFAYSRRLLIDQKFRIFFTVYNSFFVSLPFFILFSLNAENDWYNPLIIFVWCELWGLLGLVKINGKKQKTVCDAGGKDEQGEGKFE